MKKEKAIDMTKIPKTPHVRICMGLAKNCVCAQQKHGVPNDGSAMIQREQDTRSCEGELREFYFDGKIHRDPAEGPARTLYCNRAQSKLCLITYLWKGRLHRDPEVGPACIAHDAQTGVVVHEQYYWKGKEHRLNGPALIERDATSGSVTAEFYMQHGKLHREVAPAEIYYDIGRLMVTAVGYYNRGRAHRVNGPAYMKWDRNGELTGEAYYRNGVLHRDDGPAKIAYDQRGDIAFLELWRNGALIDYYAPEPTYWPVVRPGVMKNER
ncbi:MAG: hypothetical protein EKK41_15280 [Hyphomicrobiales bacterium]|nr:MAG: hypothetical protein EKK41_15280 [Hyphomicrobiales bacterium]